MNQPLRIAIHGAAGRMGRRLVALAAADKSLAIVAALEAPGHPHLGQDAGMMAGVGPLGVPLSSQWTAQADVVLDFSVPEALDPVVDACVARRTALVAATTGLQASQLEHLRQAATQVPVLFSPNMSLAVNLAMRLAEAAAKALRHHDADVEILERHHRFKEDAPSGTALRFGEIIAGVMGQTLHRHGRQGRVGARPRQEIGYHAVRIGDNPGEHAIVFGMLGETLELVVRASSRDCYAAGALAAAKFLAGKPPGYYSMNDVLGLT